MEKTYDPQAIEQKWYQYWEKQNLFAPKGIGKPYCIMIPPPNVTGVLHMGHAFQNSLIDALIRYHRMQQYNTLWQVGTDHAGISTQMVVERQLVAQKLSRHTLGRKEFINRVWQWKETSGNTITKQLRRLGTSPDWHKERFTLDPGLSNAVHKVFVQLYREGLIYRGQRLVNWDPVLHTAISDLEVIAEEEAGQLWHINYPLVTPTNNISYLTVATTRPETMLGDTAIAVHPEDQRYIHLIGKQVQLPLTNRQIPIIADLYVDPSFGTGCVKITPAHDFNDYAIGERHNLPKINILTPDAKLNEHAPPTYQGLDRFVAREKIVQDLQALGLLNKIENHTLKIPRGDQTKAVIEPYLTDQWFVKIAPLAKPAIDAVANGKIKFVPETWSKTYFEWMENIHDWCISRQLWWGHRIPAWYDANGNIYVGEDEIQVRNFYKLSADLSLTQDADVLDTWFSSALWPFSTLGWPEKTDLLATFYPTDVLITGFDIIFFWVARMIMFGLKFTDQVPFKTVYIHGLIQDHEGQKMSKSKGNVLDPLDMIDGINLEELVNKRTTGLMQPQMAKAIEQNTRKQFPQGIPNFGTDALRFTFYSIATTGRHIRFELSRLEGYRNFCNKLWNASRYVLMNTQDHPNDFLNTPKTYSIVDQWILSRWQKVKSNILDHLSKYRFDLAAHDIYEFIWNEYCDWYLELSKPILWQNQEQPSPEKSATRYTLLTLLEEILRVIHPFMPFITEEIWQLVNPLLKQSTPANTSIMTQVFPVAEPQWLNTVAEEDVAWIQQFILAIRNIRGEMNIAPGKLLSILLIETAASDSTEALVNINRITKYSLFLTTLAKINSTTWLEPNTVVPKAVVTLLGSIKILISLAGLIDTAAETARLKREITKLNQNLAKATSKLDNPNYVAKAPEAVVAKERELITDLTNKLTKLNESLMALQDS